MILAQREDDLGGTEGSRMPAEDLLREAPDDGVIAPALIGGQQPHRGNALLLLADALEGLVAAAGGEQGEALELGLVVEQVDAEYLGQVGRAS